MNTVLLELPMDALALPAASPEELAQEAKFMLALKLFEVGRLSSGKAGALCGMGRVEFLLAAGRAGVPVVALDEDELSAEFAENA
jgi:predicted HTH domain antitoxin